MRLISRKYSCVLPQASVLLQSNRNMRFVHRLNYSQRMKLLLLATPIALASLVFTTSTASTLPATRGDITFRVSGMDNSKGVVRVVLYSDEKTFLSEYGFAVADSAFARANGIVEVTLHNVPFGTYAAAFYQDENQNGVIDQNMFRIPTEPYAFSNGVRAKWKVPDFNKVAFRFEQSGAQPDVTLRDWSSQ